MSKFMEDFNVFFDGIKNNYFPNLQEIATNAICKQLWGQLYRNIPLNMFNKCYDFDYINPTSNVIEGRLKNIINQLSLPQTMKNDLLYTIYNFRLQTNDWIENHNEICDFKSNNILVNDLIWTNLGTIDRVKTAEMIISKEETDKLTKYKLECLYCFQDSARNIWETINLDDKLDFINSWFLFNSASLQLTWIWTDFLVGDGLYTIFKDMHQNRLALSRAINSGNLTAVKYFFNQLTIDEKKKVLLNFYYFHTNEKLYLIYDMDISIFLYLFAYMDKQYQKMFFEKFSYHLVKKFLKWPWQRFFLEVVDYLYCFLSDQECSDVIRKLLKNVRKSGNGVVCKQLFASFWARCSIGQQELAFFQDEWKDLEDEIVESILKNVFYRDKLIFFSNHGYNICKYLMMEDKWEKMIMLKESFVLSKEVGMKFKSEIESDIDLSENQKNVIYRLVDDLIK